MWKLPAHDWVSKCLQFFWRLIPLVNQPQGVCFKNVGGRPWFHRSVWVWCGVQWLWLRTSFTYIDKGEPSQTLFYFSTYKKKKGNWTCWAFFFFRRFAGHATNFLNSEWACSFWMEKACLKTSESSCLDFYFSTDKKGRFDKVWGIK